MEWLSGCRFFHLDTPEKRKIAAQVTSNNVKWDTTSQYALVTQNNTHNEIIQHCVLVEHEGRISVLHLTKPQTEEESQFHHNLVLCLCYCAKHFSIHLKTNNLTHNSRLMDQG